jgi:peptidoglycan L-alanyl-D-glutamate endopeptidase CwlK
MISSRKLEDLLPAVQRKFHLFAGRLEQEGIDILCISTFRDSESQNALYEQGRSLPGHIVTNAKGGESFHQYRCAFDAVPLKDGKPLWNVFDKDNKMVPTWETVAKVAEEVGLEWAGNWHSFKEYDHFQWTNGLTLKDLQTGKQIPDAN